MGYSCSYSWKSIWSSKALLQEGITITWKVGNRAKINICIDPGW